MSNVTDQRVLRGRRNRAAIVDAVVDLVESGNLTPTADQIAAKAGVARRSVYHHFTDLDDLSRAVAEKHLGRYVALLQPIQTEGPFDERRTAFVAQRCSLAEQIMPVYRASVLAAPSSKVTAAQLVATDEYLRHELRKTFSAELRAAPSWTIEALDAATSANGWVRLRIDQQLSVARARNVVNGCLVTLLEPYS